MEINAIAEKYGLQIETERPPEGAVLCHITRDGESVGTVPEDHLAGWLIEFDQKMQESGHANQQTRN